MDLFLEVSKEHKIPQSDAPISKHRIVWAHKSDPDKLCHLKIYGVRVKITAASAVVDTAAAFLPADWLNYYPHFGSIPFHSTSATTSISDVAAAVGPCDSWTNWFIVITV